MKIYEEIERLQTILWSGEDRIDQDKLFDAQDLLADIALRVAESEGQVERLVGKFPFLYRRRKFPFLYQRKESV